MFDRKKTKKVPVPEGSRIFREAFLRKDTIEPIARNRKKPNLRAWGVLSLWIIFLGTLSYVVLISPFHGITSVSIVGSRNVSQSELERYLSEQLSGERLFLFPKNNFFLFSERAIEARMLETYPLLLSVRAEKTFPNRLDIRVEERDRILLWCSGGPCVLVDDNGYAQEARFAESAGNMPFLVRIIDESAALASFGDRLFGAGDRERLLSLERGLREGTGLGIRGDIFSPARVSREYRFRTDAGWDILTDPSIEPEKTVSTLLAVLEHEIPDNRRSMLRYIDLRTENRAYYAFNESSPSETTDESDAKGSEVEKEKNEKEKDAR